MAKTKEISRRLKSIANTKKITKAMEMVAAAKMRKAIESVLRTRTYANLSWETILHLAHLSESRSEAIHQLLAKRHEVKRVAVVLVASNRGLCGGFNASIISKARESVKKHQADTDFIILGKKGLSAVAGYKLAAEFEKSDLVQSVAEVSPVAKMVIADFLSGKYDKVMLAYTDFVSPSKQIARVKQLLPVDIEAEDQYLGVVRGSEVATSQEFISGKEDEHLQKAGFNLDYAFEPDPAAVLDRMIPKLIEVQLYQSILESNASEHSARMAAMHQATEAATDMAAELNLFYNKARQASITSEIAEISAGANALSDN
jgi:F-type H+-transporting ATPase subunit gamma